MPGPQFNTLQWHFEWRVLKKRQISQNAEQTSAISEILHVKIRYTSYVDVQFVIEILDVASYKNTELKIELRNRTNFNSETPSNIFIPHTQL
jgi:hypothetical protein